jgi:hypothetical protein
MVSVRQLCRQQKKSWEEVVALAHAQGHPIYRLRRGSKLRFYILPITAAASNGAGGSATKA